MSGGSEPLRCEYELDSLFALGMNKIFITKTPYLQNLKRHGPLPVRQIQILWMCGC